MNKHAWTLLYDHYDLKRESRMDFETKIRVKNILFVVGPHTVRRVFYYIQDRH